MLGQQIYKSTVNQPQLIIPLKSIAGSNGVYFVSVYDGFDDSVSTQKVILK